MSPFGEDFRNRLRMFPSLVNCTTIDWFSEWPDDALQAVATVVLTTRPTLQSRDASTISRTHAPDLHAGPTIASDIGAYLGPAIKVSTT